MKIKCTNYTLKLSTDTSKIFYKLMSVNSKGQLGQTVQLRLSVSSIQVFSMVGEPRLHLSSQVLNSCSGHAAYEMTA